MDSSYKNYLVFKIWEQCVGLEQFVQDQNILNESGVCSCVWFVHFSCSTFPRHMAAAQLSSVRRTGNRNNSFATHSTVLHPSSGPRQFVTQQPVLLGLCNEEQQRTVCSRRSSFCSYTCSSATGPRTNWQTWVISWCLAGVVCSRYTRPDIH